jgi:phosphomannomutase
MCLCAYLLVDFGFHLSFILSYHIDDHNIIVITRSHKPSEACGFVSRRRFGHSLSAVASIVLIY